MKKVWMYGVVILAALIIIGLVITKMLDVTVYPKNVQVLGVNVIGNDVKLKGTFAASGLWYKTYKADYDNGKFFVRIIGRSFKMPNSSGEFDISIHNNYGNIKEVYLTNGNHSEDVRIWSAS